MQVKHILSKKGREVVSIASDATLSEAARLMTRRRIGAVVVKDKEGGIEGILSERDVVRAIAEESVAALGKTVGSRMTRDVSTCSEFESVEELMEMMTSGRFRHLPVLNEDRLVGLVSIGDVVKSRIEETVREAADLRDYIVAR